MSNHLRQGVSMSSSSAGWVERGLAVWLSLTIVLQPVLLHASDVRPADANTTLDQAANGTRIVNIATPSASGLSHNRYGTFNVSEQGVILNNSREVVRTDIGGFIEANPNLASGSASLILNEVVSRNPSSLLGPIEVGGQQADVVIANPNGITCNGCGFINTVRATLTTGTPQLFDGALTGFDVHGGAVGFEGTGANMQDTARFDVIAGAIRLNAEIQGRDLNLVAGHHQVAYSDLSLAANDATPISSPEFAISSSAVGGIYGDRIRLIANDAGVGVHLDAPVAAQLGSIEMNVDGALRFARVSATDDVTISAHSIVADGAATAGDHLDLTADTSIHLAAETSEARHIDVDAQHLQIDADAALTGDVLVANLHSIDNSGVIRIDEANISVATTLDNHGVIEGQNLTLSAADIGNADGSIVATDRLTVTVDDYVHRGEVQAGELVLNSAGDILVEQGSEWRLAGRANFSAVGELRNESILSAADDMTISAGSIVNEGDLAAQGGLSLAAEKIENLSHALILGQSVRIQTDQLTNAGDLYAITDLVMAGLNGSHVETLLNRSGLIGTLSGDIDMKVRHLINEREGEYVFLPEWHLDGYRWPSERDEECFHNNFASGCSSPAYRDSLRHQYVPEEQLAQVARQGVILAGANLTLDGETLDNRHSLFASYGDMTLTVRDRISNEALIMDLRDEVRTDRSRYREGSYNSSGSRNEYIYSTIPHEEDPAFCNRDRVRCGQDQGAVVSIGADIPTVILSAVLGAAGVLNIITDVLGNGEHGEGMSFATAADYLAGDGLPEAAQLYRLDPLNVGGFTLPGRNGLFLFNGSADHPYLIETNPLFASYKGFMGSSYMLDRLGWNPEPGQRLLGDSFYELNLLQNSLMGQPVLAGAAQEERELFFTLLMDQGIAAAESLELSVGVSLSAEQINALQTDIIWLEERIVAGYRVLVPVVYLANGIQVPDAVIAGQSVTLDVASLDNGGTIRAVENLTATASDGSITNTGTMLAGETLSLTASEDIINRSGLISGHDITLTAEGDIRNETAVEHISMGRHELTVLGDQARIEATGKLTLDSGKDVLVRGAELSAEQLHILAGGNIRVDTLEIRRSYNMDSPARTRLDTVTHLSSEISSALDTLMRAEQDIVLAGARLTGGTDVSLFAGNDLRLEAVQDRYYSYLKESSSSTFSSKKVITETRSTEQIGSQIVAGGKLTLEAEKGEVALLASTGHGEQGVSVNAGTDVRIESGVNREYERTQIIKKNAARVKTHDRGSDIDSLAIAGLSSGADLEINADGNVQLNAGMLVARDTLQIGQATVSRDDTGAMLLDEKGQPVIERGTIDNIALGTVELNSRKWDVTTRELRGPVKELAKAAFATLGVGAFALPELALLDLDATITLSSKEGDRTEQRAEAGSQLAGQNVLLVAQDNITLTGATVIADEVEGSVVALADSILLDTAVTDTTHTLINEEESVAGIKPSLSKDEVSLGGVEITDHRESTVTQTVTHTGTSISGNQIVLQADSAITLINADLAATGADGSLTLDSSVLTVTGIQDTKQVNHTEETEVTTMTVGIRNAYVDAAYAVKAVKDAGEEVDRARRALSDAERAHERGEISTGALHDYRGMLAMATANFLQAELAAAQALAAAATAAGPSAGTGFYVSGAAQVTETRTEQNDNYATWQGSTLSAANMSINADVASIIGSDITAGALSLNAGSILLGAGTSTQSSTFEQESRNVGAGVSSSGAGSWNANAGYNEASSSSEATQHVNTRINVGHLSSTSDELTLRGAVVIANTADITTGTLTVESLQDTHKSENSSWGVNVGVGAGTDSVGKPQSGSGGANFAKGSSEGAITGEQTAILIGNGADSQITAKHTHLIGGMIANASWEMPEGADDGTAPVLVDHGQLNFSTGTLTVEDLRDYSRSSQTGAGLQISASTTTISATDEGHRMEGKTQATIGKGNVLVGGIALDEHADFGDLNRDLDKGQIVTLDQQTGAMNASVTFDNRMFTAAGWKDIKEQHQELGRNWQLVSTALERDFQRVSVDLMPSAVKDGLVFVDGVTGGFLPFDINGNGGLLGQLAVSLGSRDIYNRQLVVVSSDSDFFSKNPDMKYMPIEDHPMYATLSEERQKELAGLLYTDVSNSINENTVTRHNFTNGMLNSEMDALSNGFQQTQLVLDGGVRIGPVEFTLNFNPSRGGIGDFLEIASDKLSGMGLYKIGHASGMAKQTGEFMLAVDANRGGISDIVFSAHSQGNILSYTGAKLYDFKASGMTYFMSAGSPVNNAVMFSQMESSSIEYRVSQSKENDFVAETLGGNRGLYLYNGANALSSHGFEDIINTVKAPVYLFVNGTDFIGLFRDGSPHSSYRCVTEAGLCGVSSR
jgi:filamentous hemagglutinin family protein